MSRLIILDWRGTLDQIGDQDEIREFVSRLHHQGDKTIGFSSRLPRDAPEFTFGNHSSKRLSELRGLVKEHKFTEVVLCDDSMGSDIAEFWLSRFGVEWRFITAKYGCAVPQSDLLSLLK